MTTPRFVGAEEIRRILSFPTLIAVLESAHRRPNMEVQNGLLGNEKAQYFVRQAVDGGPIHAQRINTSFPANPTQQ
jgi:ornithine cyclodeaminase